MQREQLDFLDAIRYLADKAHIELHEQASITQHGPKKNRLYECLEQAMLFFEKALFFNRSQPCAQARSYFSSRGFSSEVSKKWHLGYAIGHGLLVSHLRSLGFTLQEIEAADLCIQGRDRFYNRVMFPIFDEQNRCIGFGGRVLDDAKPKYLNTKETVVFHKSKQMYAFNKARDSIVAQKHAIVVEGYTDVIAMHMAGFTQTVATLGTALTHDHVTLLSRFASKIIFMFDGDAAGQKAAKRALKFLDSTQADLRCVILPNNLDPADFLRQHTSTDLQAYLDTARPLIDFVFESSLASYDISVPGQLVAAFEEMSGLLSVFKHSVLLDSYATRLADALHMDVDKTRKAIQQANPPKDLFESPESQARNTRPMTHENKFSQQSDSSSHVLQASAEQIEQMQQRNKILHVMGPEDREQLRFEVELLSLCAEYTDAIRPYHESISNIMWVDDLHGEMVERMLATSPHTSPSVVVQVATEVHESAPQILAGAHLTAVEKINVEKTFMFVMTNIELYMSIRKLKRNRQVLKTTVSQEEARTLLEECEALTQHVDKLRTNLSKF